MIANVPAFGGWFPEKASLKEDRASEDCWVLKSIPHGTD